MGMAPRRRVYRNIADVNKYGSGSTLVHIVVMVMLTQLYGVLGNSDKTGQ